MKNVFHDFLNLSKRVEKHTKGKVRVVVRSLKNLEFLRANFWCDFLLVRVVSKESNTHRSCHQKTFGGSVEVIL